MVKLTINKKAKELLEELKKANLTVIDEAFFMRIKIPYTHWFMCRNEEAVAIEIKT